jgi:hypothetical protein
MHDRGAERDPRQPLTQLRRFGALRAAVEFARETSRDERQHHAEHREHRPAGEIELRAPEIHAGARFAPQPVGARELARPEETQQQFDHREQRGERTDDPQRERDPLHAERFGACGAPDLLDGTHIAARREPCDRVDRPDRDTGDERGHEREPLENLEHADLVRTQRSAPGQDERDATVRQVGAQPTRHRGHAVPAPVGREHDQPTAAIAGDEALAPLGGLAGPRARARDGMHRTPDS